MILAPFVTILRRQHRRQLNSGVDIKIEGAVNIVEFTFRLHHSPIPFSEMFATIKDSDFLQSKNMHIKPNPLHGMLIFDFLSQ